MPMTEDPREFGLTATDLRAAADRLYGPADTRLDQLEWTQAQQARFGQIRSRLRGLADAIDGGPAGTTPASRHVRPAIADQQAVLAVAAAILGGAAPQLVHGCATPAGTCAACTIVTAVQFAFTIALSMSGQDFMTSELHAQLAGMVEHALAELRAGPN